MQVSGSGEYPSALGIIGHRIARQTEQAEAQVVASTLENAKQMAQTAPVAGSGGHGGRGQLVDKIV